MGLVGVELNLWTKSLQPSRCQRILYTVASVFLFFFHFHFHFHAFLLFMFFFACLLWVPTNYRLLLSVFLSLPQPVLHPDHPPTNLNLRKAQSKQPPMNRSVTKQPHEVLLCRKSIREQYVDVVDRSRHAKRTKEEHRWTSGLGCHRVFS